VLELGAVGHGCLQDVCNSLSYIWALENVMIPLTLLGRTETVVTAHELGLWHHRVSYD
jgi:hypothetical protein